MPEHIGRMLKLQTLLMFIAGTHTSKSLAQLQRLQLKEDLHIKQMEHVKHATEAKLANLRGKSLLHSLSLSLKHYDEFCELSSKVVLECIEPPQSLKSLCIEGYPGFAFQNGSVQVNSLI